MMTLEALKEFPRKRLWHAPTPLEPQHNLARETGAGSFLIKRDDCNGLAFGGNKVRQLEYYTGDALAKGADTLLITGAVQSNFVRTAAAACAKHGLRCHVQLENRVEKSSPEYTTSGNVLLDHMFGATVHTYPAGEDEEGADRNLDKLAKTLEAGGRKPYIVHLHPSHPPLGALGYIHCAEELSLQFEELDGLPDRIFVASGSGNTHGGLLYGLRALGIDIPVTGVCVRREAKLQHHRIVERLNQIAILLGVPCPAKPDDVEIEEAFFAPGYGIAGKQTQKAIIDAARLEALVLDPVYTGKAFAAAQSWVRENPGGNVLFIHTGGTPAIFAYREDMMAMT